MSDIVQRLRNPNHAKSSHFARSYMTEAADELEAAEKAEAMMREEIGRLRSELANTRNSALEEAAKLAEDSAARAVTFMNNRLGGYFNDFQRFADGCKSTARLIRALKADGESR